MRGEGFCRRWNYFDMAKWWIAEFGACFGPKESRRSGVMIWATMAMHYSSQCGRPLSVGCCCGSTAATHRLVAPAKWHQQRPSSANSEAVDNEPSLSGKRTCQPGQPHAEEKFKFPLRWRQFETGRRFFFGCKYNFSLKIFKRTTSGLDVWRHLNPLFDAVAPIWWMILAGALNSGNRLTPLDPVGSIA